MRPVPPPTPPPPSASRALLSYSRVPPSASRSMLSYSEINRGAVEIFSVDDDPVNQVT